MQLISAAQAASDVALAEVTLMIDRFTLAKRLWRATADDGVEFGFELSAPLKNGDVIFESKDSRYVICQIPEAVLEIALDVTPAAAAGIGWAVGNMHLELSAEPTRLLAADEPPMRQLLERLKVPFKTTTAVFRPGRFARGNQSTHDLGTSHRH